MEIQKGKIKENAWYSPVSYLPKGTEVDYIDQVNEDTIQVRYCGYNYLIKKTCFEFKEKVKKVLKVKNGTNFSKYGFNHLKNGCWKTNSNTLDNKLQFSLFIDENNILSIYVSNNNINYDFRRKYFEGEHYYSVDDVISNLFVDLLFEDLTVIFEMIKDGVITLETI